MQENKKNLIYLSTLIALIVLLFFLIRPEKISSMEFNILDDEKLSSDDIDKILILNFWATDCPTCIKEMPDLAKIHQEFKMILSSLQSPCLTIFPAGWLTLKT